MQTSSVVKFAVFIRAARNALNMSQSKLATLAKCSRPTINRIESLDKESSPKLETIERVLQVFSEQGIEFQFAGNEVTIKFNEKALLQAERNITAKLPGLLD